MLSNFVGFSGGLASRELHLLAMGCVLLPLCLLRSLSRIAHVARAGLLGVIYTAVSHCGQTRIPSLHVFLFVCLKSLTCTRLATGLHGVALHH